MQKPERSTFTSLDFVQWQESESLVLTPKFQRRGVWKTPARSHLIDTMIRGMPVPPIYLRERQSDDKKRIVREVIDGQQRLSAVLDFIAGEFTLSKNLGIDHGGRYFDDLPQDKQDAIREFTFSCERFSSISDIEVLEIFSRLNTYSVPLTQQELRNGRFFGPFKRSMYELGTEYLEFWRRNRIFTEMNIARMSEAELISELTIMSMSGLQDKKKSIDEYYDKFDEKYPDKDKNEKRLRSVIDTIARGFEAILPSSEFRRTPLFYSLFAVIYHRIYGLPNQKLATPKKGRLSSAELQSLGDAMITLSEEVVSAKRGDTVPKEFSRFVNACLSQTDNIRPRQVRFQEIYRRAFPHA